MSRISLVHSSILFLKCVKEILEHGSKLGHVQSFGEQG